MRYVRIWADDVGESHFEDVDVALAEVELAPPAPPLLVADPVPCERLLLFGAPAGWFGDWHPAPARQFVLMLAGEIEVDVSDGERRRLAAGDVALLEDVSGKGHATRVIGDADVRAAFVQLAA